METTSIKSDQNIQLKVYDTIINKELAAALLEASLTRDGQKITSIILQKKLEIKAKKIIITYVK